MKAAPQPAPAPRVLAAALAALAGCATAGAHPEPSALPRPDLVPVARALVAIEAAERRGHAAEERARYLAEAAGHPRDPVPRFLAAAAAPTADERWGEHKAASSEFPDSALGHVGQARTYVEWGTFDQVQRALRTALELEPDNWLAVLVRAQAAERRELPESAAADYRTVLSADPQDAEALLGLARLARRAGDTAGARARAQEALKAAPDLYGAWALLAELAEADGDAAAATAFWEGAVDAGPRERPARIRLAKLWTQQGDAARARDQWKAAAALKEDAPVLAALAEASRASGDAAGEAGALERLSVLDPSRAAWGRVAELRLAAADGEGAEKALRRALARDPKDAQANLAMGRLQLARGESQDALASLRAAGPAGEADRAALERRLNLEPVSRGDVGGLQRAVQALVDRTYRARLADMPSLSGNLRLRVTVDGSGAATVLEVLEDTVHDPDVRACAYWNLHDATYPSDKPGRYSFGFAFRK